MRTFSTWVLVSSMSLAGCGRAPKTPQANEQSNPKEKTSELNSGDTEVAECSLTDTPDLNIKILAKDGRSGDPLLAAESGKSALWVFLADVPEGCESRVTMAFTNAPSGSEKEIKGNSAALAFLARGEAGQVTLVARDLQACLEETKGDKACRDASEKVKGYSDDVVESFDYQISPGQNQIQQDQLAQQQVDRKERCKQGALNSLIGAIPGLFTGGIIGGLGTAAINSASACL